MSLTSPLLHNPDYVHNASTAIDVLNIQVYRNDAGRHKPAQPSSIFPIFSPLLTLPHSFPTPSLRRWRTDFIASCGVRLVTVTNATSAPTSLDVAESLLVCIP